MRPGTKVKYEEKICPGIPINRSGKIITEYKYFYLVLTPGGYRECLNKNVKMEVLK